MFNLSRIETRTQEITFLISLTGALTTLIFGLSFLFLNPTTLSQITGHLGSNLLASSFNQLGYASFSICLSFLILGHYILNRVSNFQDLLNYKKKLTLQIIAQIALIIMVASYLSVLHSHYQFIIHPGMHSGAGGALGLLLGGSLYQAFGIYGALTTLTLTLLIAGIVSGHIQLVNIMLESSSVLKSLFSYSFRTTKTVSKKTAQVGLNLTGTGLEVISRQPAVSKQLIKIDKKLNFLMPKPKLNSDEVVLSNSPQIDSDDSEIEIEHSLSATKRTSRKIEIIQANGDSQKITDQIEKPVKRTTKKIKKKAKAADQTDSLSEEIKASEASTEEIIETSSKKQIQLKKWTKKYKKPETTLLKKAPKHKTLSKTEIATLCKTLEERLHSFQIKGEIIDAHVGIRLTMFEFQPAPGVKLSKLSSLNDDLALVLGAESIRILTPIPGKMTVGIEVPNKEAGLLTFSELIKPVLADKKSELPIAMGTNVNNEVIISDITKMPHLLVSGTTGSGKSVFMNSLITSLIYNKSPKELRFLMVDPKMIELSPYNGIPHLLKPVITDVTEAKDSLVWAEKEMDKRYQMFAQTNSRNITSFNEHIKKSSKKATEQKSKSKLDWEWAEMPYIVVVIDELADLMITQGKDVEIPITRIAQKARAAGIHLVIATQRPSADIVTGLIKTNFPTRIAFKVSSGIDSRTIIDASGAEKLLGNGDMLFMPNGKALQRIQGSFLSEDEVKKIVQQIS